MVKLNVSALKSGVTAFEALASKGSYSSTLGKKMAEKVYLKRGYDRAVTTIETKKGIKTVETVRPRSNYSKWQETSNPDGSIITTNRYREDDFVCNMWRKESDGVFETFTQKSRAEKIRKNKPRGPVTYTLFDKNNNRSLIVERNDIGTLSINASNVNLPNGLNLNGSYRIYENGFVVEGAPKGTCLETMKDVQDALVSFLAKCTKGPFKM